MDLEEDATILIRIDPRIPRAEVDAIGARLTASGALTAGFIPPDRGLLDLEAMAFAETFERVPTVLLPDRNVVTRMARIAREGRLGRDDAPTRLAVDLMAFCQTVNIDIEPGLAFHELVQSMGDEVANEELRWFRVADEGRATAWIDLAAGKTDHLPPLEAGPSQGIRLSDPPHRWRCNQAVMLRAAALELDAGLAPIRRFEALVDWMVTDFILAGPAAILCMLFLSPTGERGGLVKGLRSPDRKRALAGVRNAAWDATYLSELTRRAQPDSYEKARCILASADRALAGLAPLLLIDAEDPAEHRRELAMRIEDWWGRDAGRVVDILMEGIEAIQGRPAPESPPGVDDYVGLKIDEGEALVSQPVGD